MSAMQSPHAITHAIVGSFADILHEQHIDADDIGRESMEDFPHSVEFGALLKQLRTDEQLSQEELAARAGMSVRGLSDLERGVRRQPHKQTVMALVNALRLTDEARSNFLAAARGMPSLLTPASGAAAHSSNLPEPLTPLIGRDSIASDVATLFRTRAARLATLLGPAGIGKTRLSVHVATSLLPNFTDGAHFVSLAASETAEDVLTSIARVLEVRLTNMRPIQLNLHEALRERHLLLVLDNFEQVVQAGPLLSAILQECPHVCMLVTSRAILRLRGEHLVDVPPLAVPDAHDSSDVSVMERYSALTLLVQRAQVEVQPTPENIAAIVAICRHLDGLPLAIELAAAWLRVLTPAALRERLMGDVGLQLLSAGSHDAPTRHQTMTAALQWSYGLLDERERRLFRILGVFTGRFTLTALEALSTSLSVNDLLFTLASLVDKSLVQRDSDLQANTEARFHLLETIHAFSREQVIAQGEQDLFARHARYYRDLVVENEAALGGHQQLRWITRLADEYENIRAALHWFLNAKAWEDGLQFASACWRFWYVRGYLREGRQWLDRFLAGGSDASSAVRAHALFGAATLAAEQGDYQQAVTLATDSVALYRALSEWRGVASALNVCGNIAKYQGDFARATDYFTECLLLYRQVEHSAGVAVALNNLATVAMEQGEYEQAEQLQDQSLEIKRALGDQRGQAVTLVNMGDTARDQGLFARAASLAEEALALFTDLGDVRGQALAHNNLGEALGACGEQARGKTALLAGLSLFRQVSDSWGIAVALKNLGDLMCDEDVHQAIGYYSEALTLYRQEDNQLGIAELFESLGHLGYRQGMYADAVRFLSAGAQLRQATGTRVPSVDARAIVHDITSLRAALEPQMYAAVWRQGMELTVSDSIIAAQTFCQRWR
jgi:predicted ATPase/DNA-binding XRE family transcriptional regulator